jgi:hypothetical protein
MQFRNLLYTRLDSSGRHIIPIPVVIWWTRCHYLNGVRQQGDG